MPRFLLALYAGLMLNSFLMFFWGDSGLSRMKALQVHRDKLAENIADLESIHDELTLERDSLLYDTSEIELRAGAFGYHQENEVPVKLPGHDVSNNSHALGTLVRQTPASRENRLTFRVVALCFAGVVFGTTFLWRKHGYSGSRG